MKTSEPLNDLACEFFREFAQCEFCLKAAGLYVPDSSDAKADWRRFAAEVTDTFDDPPNPQFDDAIRYYQQRPPKKQVIRDGLLTWEEVQPTYSSQAELLLLLIRRVRNNLFHGGKFNGHWLEPQRSDELLRHGLSILRTVVEAHPGVREVYANKAA